MRVYLAPQQQLEIRRDTVLHSSVENWVTKGWTADLTDSEMSRDDIYISTLTDGCCHAVHSYEWHQIVY